LDITAAVPPGHYELYRRALEIAANYKKLSSEELMELQRVAEGVTPLFKHP
jgi:hypothetical protein